MDLDLLYHLAQFGLGVFVVIRLGYFLFHLFEEADEDVQTKILIGIVLLAVAVGIFLIVLLIKVLNWQHVKTSLIIVGIGIGIWLTIKFLRIMYDSFVKISGLHYNQLSEQSGHADPNLRNSLTEGGGGSPAGKPPSDDNREDALVVACGDWDHNKAAAEITKDLPAMHSSLKSIVVRERPLQ